MEGKEDKEEDEEVGQGLEKDDWHTEDTLNNNPSKTSFLFRSGEPVVLMITTLRSCWW